MRGTFVQDGSRLIRTFDSEQLWIEPWGANSLRIRATHRSRMNDEDWALLAPEPTDPEITIADSLATIRNGRIEARVSEHGVLEFRNQRGELLLREYVRRRDSDPPRSPLKISPRDFKGIVGGDYSLTQRFESDPSERIFGMGQYQQELLDLKGCQLELAHRNSQVSIPFALSSLGYGLLWNNPAIGRVVFGRNITEWHAQSTPQLDYWITAGDTPAEIEEAYATATGKVPLMPEFATGYWQSRLRYQTQEELPRRRARAPPPRAPHEPHRCRLLPLAEAGRLALRPTLLARSRGDGRRAPVSRDRADGLDLAYGRQDRRSLPRNAPGRLPDPHRARHANDDGVLRQHPVRRRHQPGRAALLLERHQRELLESRRSRLLAR